METAVKEISLPFSFIEELADTVSTIQVAEVIARWLRFILDADRASITIYDGNNALKLIALEGNTAIPLNMLVPVEGTMVGRVFRNAATEICGDLSNSTDLDCMMLASNGILSCLDTPLVCAGICLGTINAGRCETDAFTGSDARLLEVLGRFIATVIRIHSQNERLRTLAERDPLTDALNRRAFIERYSMMRARRDKEGYGIALIDLDHFKQINDTFGHSVGDEVLIDVSRVLQAACRSDDLMARFGGEEFCIAVSGITSEDFCSLLNRLHNSLRITTLQSAGHQINLTASIGALWSNDEHLDFDEIYASADKALYQAKRQGRDCIEFARPH